MICTVELLLQLDLECSAGIEKRSVPELEEHLQTLTLNYCNQSILLKLTNASLKCLFCCTKWKQNLQNDIE